MNHVFMPSRMMKYASVLFLACGVFLSGCLGTNLRIDQANILPDEKTYDGLKPLGKKKTYAGEDAIKRYLGGYGKLFYQYGTRNIYVRDYELGKPDQTLTVEIYTLNSDKSAAGLFHYHRGRILRNMGTPVDVGVEGVVDTFRGGRSLYFYKQLTFVKLIYTGGKPVPDLVPLANAIARDIAGDNTPPTGVEHLNVEGVNPETWRVSPGYVFNYEFLSTGIFAKAPGAGSVAEVFIIGCFDDNEAKRCGSDYRLFLQLNGKDYTVKHKTHSRMLWWAQDPTQGRVVCTVQDDFLIGILRPQTYEMAEVVLDRIADHIKDAPRLKREEKKKEKQAKQQAEEQAASDAAQDQATPATPAPAKPSADGHDFKMTMPVSSQPSSGSASDTEEKTDAGTQTKSTHDLLPPPPGQ